MTMDSGQPATSAVSGGQGVPPIEMVIRRSRSLSELPGSLRVPIIARRGDGDRMRVRLEASREGLEELKMLREQQQQLVDQVKAAASQRRGNASRQNHARRASASMRSSTASLARISEDGPLDTSLSGNLGSRDESLRDFTNLSARGLGDWRSTQTGRSRRPLSMSDSCFLEGALYVEAKQSGAGGNFGAAGSSLRKVRSLDSFGPDRSVPAPQSARRASTQGLHRSDSYRDTTSTSPSYTAGPYGQYRTFAGMATSDGVRTNSALSSPAGSTLSFHRADLSADYAEHEAVATFEGKTRKVGRSHSFSVGPGPSLVAGLWVGSAQRPMETSGEQILPTAAMESLYGSENMEPKLRRASLQCEAVLTGSSGRQRDVFRDVDIRCDFPSPLHAVLRQYSGAKGSVLTPRSDTQAQTSPNSKTSMTPSQIQAKTSMGGNVSNRSHSCSDINSGSKGYNGTNVSAINNNGDAGASVTTSPMMVSRSPITRTSSISTQSVANSSTHSLSHTTPPRSTSPQRQKIKAANGVVAHEQTNKTCSGRSEVTSKVSSASQSCLSSSSTVTSSPGLHHVASCPAVPNISPDGAVSANRTKESETRGNSSTSKGRSVSEGGPKYTSCTTGREPRQQAHERRYSTQGRDTAPRDQHEVMSQNPIEEISHRNDNGQEDASRKLKEEIGKPCSIDINIDLQSNCDSQPAPQQNTGDRLVLRKSEHISNSSDLSRTVETVRVSAKRLRARSLNEIPAALRSGSYRSDANRPIDKQSTQQPGSLKRIPESTERQAGTHDTKNNHHQKESAMASREARCERLGLPSYQPNPVMSEQHSPSPPLLPSHNGLKEREDHERKCCPAPRSSSDDVFESQSGQSSQSSPGPNKAEVSSVVLFYPENPDFKIQDWYSVKQSGSVKEGSTDEVFLEDPTMSGCKLLRARISPTPSSSQTDIGTSPQKTTSENRRSNGDSLQRLAMVPGSCENTNIQHRDGQSSHPNTSASSNGNSLRSSGNEAVLPSSSAEQTAAIISLQSAHDKCQSAVTDSTNENVNYCDISATFSAPIPSQPDASNDNKQSTPAHDVYNNNNSNNAVDDNNGVDVSSLQGGTESVQDLRNSNTNSTEPMQNQYPPSLSLTNPFSPQNRTNTNPFTIQPLPSTNPFLRQPLSPSNPFIQTPLSSTNPFVQQPLSPTNPFADQLNTSRAREVTLPRKNPNGSHQDEGYITSSPETSRGHHSHKHSFLSDSSATSAEMDESPSQGETTPGVDPIYPPPQPSDDGLTHREADRASNGNAESHPKGHVTKVPLPFRQTDL